MDRMKTDGFTLWVPLPDVPKGVMPGNISRKPTPEQQEAKYFRHAMDIRRLYPQMRYVRMEMLEHEQKLQRWEESINNGLDRDNKPGPINKPCLAVMCAKAQLASNRDVHKSLNLRYEQLLFILTEYVQMMQKERREIAAELGFTEDDPKELTTELVENSLHYDRIYRVLCEQNQTKFIYSQLEFPTPESRNDHLLRMEVECDDHIYLGCSQHIKKLFDLQATEQATRKSNISSGTLTETAVPEHDSNDVVELQTKKKAKIGSYEYFKEMDMELVPVDDVEICGHFYNDKNVAK